MDCTEAGCDDCDHCWFLSTVMRKMTKRTMMRRTTTTLLEMTLMMVTVLMIVTLVVVVAVAAATMAMAVVATVVANDSGIGDDVDDAEGSTELHRSDSVFDSNRPERPLRTARTGSGRTDCSSVLTRFPV